MDTRGTKCKFSPRNTVTAAAAAAAAHGCRVEVLMCILTHPLCVSFLHLKLHLFLVQGGGTSEGTAGNPCMDFFFVCVFLFDYPAVTVTLSHVVEHWSKVLHRLQMLMWSLPQLSCSVKSLVVVGSQSQGESVLMYKMTHSELRQSCWTCPSPVASVCVEIFWSQKKKKKGFCSICLYWEGSS